MEHSSKFLFLKYQYDLGNLMVDRLKNAVIKKYISADEFKEITGQDYVPNV